MGKKFKASTKLTAKFLVVLMVLQAVLFSLSAGAATGTLPTGITVGPVGTAFTLFTTGASTVTTKQLTATLAPSTTDSTYKGITWSSTNTAVATVSSTGLVTQVGAGTTTITATSDKVGSLAASKTINVYNSLSSVYFNNSILKKGKIKVNTVNDATYKLVFTPLNTSVTTITYKSSNTAVATVAADGTITTTALGGTANITATITLGGVVAPKVEVLALTVPVPAVSVDITKSVIGLNYILVKGLAAKSAATAFKVAGPTIGGKVTVPTDGTVTWSVADSTYATIDEKGIITPIKVGTTTVKATSKYDSAVFDTATLNIATNLTSIAFAQRAITINKGQTGIVGVIYVPSEASVNSAVYTLKQGKVGVTAVTYAADGTLTAVAPGTATLTATVTAGGITKTSTLVITVPVPVASIAITSKPEVNKVVVDKTITLTAKVAAAGTGLLPTDKTLRFKSSDYAIASVNGATGVITGIAPGTATITAYAPDENGVLKIDTRVITVTAK